MALTAYRRQTGVDVSSDRLSIPAEYASWAINRSFRGSVDSTRPPFIAYDNIFPSTEDESRIRKGNISGMIGYNSIGGLAQTSIVIAVGDSIYKARVYGRTLEWSLLYKGISSQYQMSYFVQAENLLIWQNGIDLPLYWDGVSQTMLYCKDAPGITTPMPVGNIMTYAHGRIFLAIESNIVKASKHVYSLGLAQSPYGVLDFGESEYWSDGDGFGAPASLGQITGMGVIKRSPEANGHGPVVVFQQRGAFAIDPTIPRPDWINSPNVQQIVITGRGCSSPYSVIGVNGDLWFRCTDKTIASFKNEVSRQDSWNDTSLSKEVSKFTDLDSNETLRFSFASNTDNRLLMSVGCRTAKAESGYGYHRFCLGIVSLDFEDGSTVNKGNLFTWDGLWTGIRPTGVAEIIIGQQVVSVYGSFDYDSTNRFYFLSSSGGNDIGENGESRIEWQRINEGALMNEKALTVSTLQSTRVEYFNAIGKTTINQSFKPDDYACFTSFPTADIDPEPSCAAVQVCGSSINSRPIAGHLNFLFNCSQPQLNTNRPVNKGSSFSIRTVGIGAVSIRAIYVFGSDELLQHPEPQVCSNAPIDCCSYDDNYLSYLIK
jgi:hypothetical protein